MSPNPAIEAVGAAREVVASFGRKQAHPDPDWELGFAAALREQHSLADLLDLFSRYRDGEAALDNLLRRVLCRAMCRNIGHGLQVAPGVVLRHPETMEFGDCVFIGAHAIIQGRFDGSCRIGNHVWIGPQSFLDARNLVLDDYAGWGPGQLEGELDEEAWIVEDPAESDIFTSDPERRIYSCIVAFIHHMA